MDPNAILDQLIANIVSSLVLSRGVEKTLKIHFAEKLRNSIFKVRKHLAGLGLTSYQVQKIFKEYLGLQIKDIGIVADVRTSPKGKIEILLRESDREPANVICVLSAKSRKKAKSLNVNDKIRFSGIIKKLSYPEGQIILDKCKLSNFSFTDLQEKT